MSEAMASENLREIYDVKFYKMVSEVAEDFKEEECQKLCYIFQKQFTRSFSEKNVQNPLKLLEYLQEKNLFSSDKPDKLAKLMEILDFPEKKTAVESFIDDHKDMISSLSVQQRALPQPPTSTVSDNPVEAESDELYVNMQDILSISSPNSPSTTTKPIVCESPNSVHLDEMLTGDYVCFHPSPSHFTPIQRRMSSGNKSESSRSSDQSSSTEDDGDRIYAEPYSDILMSTSHDLFPILQERMKLLVNPLRDMITNDKQHLLVGPPISCPFPDCTFTLEIDPGNDSCISAKLYLKPGPQMETSSPSTYYYVVELQVKQHSKKQKHSQDMYAHTVLMDYPTLEPQESSPTGDTNMPNSHKEKEEVPESDQVVSEQNHVSSPECSDKNGGKCGMEVASFPSIITHKNLLNEKLVNGPHLTLTFILKQYRHHLDS